MSGPQSGADMLARVGARVNAGLGKPVRPKRVAGIFECVLQERHSSILITVSFNVSPMPRECLRVVVELRAFLYLRFYACNCF